MLPEAHSKRKLLFISRLSPVPYGGGNYVYSHDLLNYVQRHGFDVWVLLLDPNLVEHRSATMPLVVPHTPFKHRLPGYLRFPTRYVSPRGVVAALLRRSAGRRPVFSPAARVAPSCGNEITPAEEAWVRQVAQETHWDAVICNYCWLSGSLRFFSPGTPTAVLTHDVWHMHASRGTGNAYVDRIDRDTEAGLLDRAGIIIAINNRDAAAFTEMLPGRRIISAPMSCTIRRSDVPPVDGRLLFVGSDYGPNIEGVRWFLETVGKELERLAPRRFELHIVGTAGNTIAPVQGGIQIVRRGFVTELQQEYASAMMVVVPLLRGTGLKVKLIEALAHGKAVVTSPVGSQGLEQFTEDAFVVCATSDDMAHRILHVAGDENVRRRLENGAHKVAREQLSPDACYRPLLRALSGKALCGDAKIG